MPDLADVVIVGGGVVGVALAHELTGRNYRVVLLEANALASAASSRSFGWINATSKTEDDQYHHLNALALADYGKLAEEWTAEALGLHGGGSLHWVRESDRAGRERLRRLGARLQSMGYPISMISADEIRALEPAIRSAPEDGAIEGLFAPADMWLDVAKFVAFFTDHLRSRGGEVRESCPATGFTRSITGAVSTVETPDGRIATRTVVLCAGSATGQLLRTVTGDPLAESWAQLRYCPGLIVRTPPRHADPVHRVLFPPDGGGLHLRPAPDGGLVMAAEDCDAEIAGQAASHADRAPTSAGMQRWARSLLTRVARVLNGSIDVENASDADTTVCSRPMPADDLPIVGPVPELSGVYVAVMHSGVTLAPTISQLLATAIVSGKTPESLARYCPRRTDAT